MRQLQSHRVGRDELVVELAGNLLKQQIVDLKASKSEAQTRKTHATPSGNLVVSSNDVTVSPR